MSEYAAVTGGHLATGYDSPGSVVHDDDLDRWPFACQVVDVIRNTPPHWSVRVGIFGRWGEGKSTVLRFVERMLRDDGNVVFWFNPWAARSWEDLWAEFSESLHQGLADAQIEVETGLETLARKASRRLKNLDDVVGKAADVTGTSKAIYGASIGLLQHWLRPDGEQITKIRQKLGTKRVVVLIDDLDRADPKLVPQLLLSLREILDLPGFAFVSAFDHDIVGEALKDYHRAWVDGEAFLEKILDFRFDLPPVDERQQICLIRRALIEQCSFVPLDSLQTVADLLPSNPRQLKALVRNMIALRSEVARRTPDELSWVDVWLAQLIRLESRGFFQYLLAGDVLETETGLGYAARQVVGQLNKEKGALSETLEKHIKTAGVTDPASISRLIALVEAVRARATNAFRFQAQIGWMPDPITGKEFRVFDGEYERAPARQTVDDWIARHAKVRSAAIEVVVDALFSTLVNTRGQELELASDCRAESDHDLHMAVAARMLKIIKAFLVDADYSTPQRFRALLDQCARWAGFITVTTDTEARSDEKQLLVQLLADERLDAMEVLDQLHPWGSLIGVTGSGAMSETLIDSCVSAVRNRCEEIAIGLFDKPGGIKRLLERGKMMAYKYCLFDSSSGIWTDVSRKEQLIRKIGESERNPVVYENCFEFFELLFMGYNVDLLGAPERKAVMTDIAFLAAIWKAATSKKIQFRLQSEYRKAHENLVANGIDPSVIPLPPELAQGPSPR